VAGIVSAGGQAAPLMLDVSGTAESVESGMAQALDCFGRLDILINNSGVTVSKPVLDQSPSDWDTVINTNLRGAFFMSQSIARHLRDAGHGGCIVNVASILGLRQAGMVAPYAASKAALIQLTKTMALELARYSIRVNALAPGYIASDLNSAFFETDAGQAFGPAHSAAPSRTTERSGWHVVTLMQRRLVLHDWQRHHCRRRTRGQHVVTVTSASCEVFPSSGRKRSKSWVRYRLSPHARQSLDRC
jgi:NAD(P)-dependent dehydrogenase (short-subunit alcohol dehydrogenase family)